MGKNCILKVIIWIDRLIINEFHCINNITSMCDLYIKHWLNENELLLNFDPVWNM